MWRERLHEIIFEADTAAGKAFDIALMACIGMSVSAVSLESVDTLNARYGLQLRIMEWIFTGLFTIEYGLRMLCTRRPLQYVKSFYGIVDLLSILPTYLSLVLEGSHYLLVIRLLRVLRVFRVLKLAQYVREGRLLTRALYASRRKVTVFLLAVVTLVMIIGSVMYMVEGEANGFTSIPRSVYWAIVTLTTVGYGDIAPQTDLGRFLASMVMILGYGILAVPTGIVSVELARAESLEVSTQVCPACTAEGHDPDAVYCKYCGSAI
ncbi:ion transporter [Candidatus Entotheonella palauensis]|uniref:ion transporter n=1 Tax=Candidatus Entotheonella palauensis TaxID=93172 RepID=UPI002118ED5E|nr:ion transporter [Candidatus Entotheonella palauensis]